MDKYVIHGQHRLQGTVSISGAKNSSLPLMAASLLTAEPVILHNVPYLMDIRTMVSLLTQLGKSISYLDPHTIKIEEKSAEPYEAPYDIVRKMRASIAVLGPLLGRRGKARVSFPGGCTIGPRPIDLHIKGMKALGAEITIEEGYINATCPELKGCQMNLLGSFGPSVLGTENVMMAAVLAKGTTIIEGAAAEPEVADLANFLNQMGANITGAGTSIITIEGVDSLHGVEYTTIPDRIEAGTFIAAAGITGGEIRIENACVHHLAEPIEIFSRAGVEIEILSDTTLIARGKNIRPIEVETKPYPFFPTDLQAQLMALVTLSDGISIISEKIFPDRFLHAAELCRMGADIHIDGAVAVVKGVPYLSGAAIMASDLRAGAGLVLAGLAARGKTEVLRIYHIDRGYEHFEEKLRALGADIERRPQEE
ncbi:UDP-N-acetylglucosamine 1-carboxyvinyltransferase [Thermospira aquatica]|uniref:UDP-N-acetylglucosamine 1-carboxyvinyltransferase n=1 Tax=Thermospira aquatica TaxID=2828656 RepID=A0AAX3BEV6_9SPIR|nr:UDP-N-acetylglucosamine 1-carboxyvinyltransferase [Thermospira aquatica]URA10231.1 UDP-N-acetylglucosamine 1-carboxyvinyltransferase [Thermospira aquatica]